MKRVLFLILCTVSFIIPCKTTFAISSYSAEQVWTKIHSSDPPLLIDVRDNSVYLEGHIPTAVNFPISNGVNEQTAINIQNYGKSEILTYCSCVDGHLASVFVEGLINHSVINVYYMHDDFRYWPYDTVNGSNPGTVLISLGSSNGVVNGTGSELAFIFLIINIFLFSLVIFLVIRKRNR